MYSVRCIVTSSSSSVEMIFVCCSSCPFIVPVCVGIAPWRIKSLCSDALKFINTGHVVYAGVTSRVPENAHRYSPIAVTRMLVFRSLYVVSCIVISYIPG